VLSWGHARLAQTAEKAVVNAAVASLRFLATDSPAFWQRRFYDFNVWSNRKVQEKLDYMHRNPVQRKLVSHPKDWPWSSWSHYEKGELGLIRIDKLDQEKSPESSPKQKRQKPHP
jgi:putative transposase